MKKKETQPKEQPEVYALKQGKSGWQFSRREFLAASSMAVTALAAAGCSPDDDSKKLNRICRSVSAHTGSTKVIKFSPDGTLLASIGISGDVKIWSVNDNQLVKTIEIPQTTYGGLEFSPDGKFLAFSSLPAGNIDLWTLPDLESSQQISAHNKWVMCLAFNSDGSLLASGSKDKVIYVWSLPDGSGFTRIPYASSLSADDYKLRVKGLAFTPDSSSLIAAFSDEIKVWSLPNGELINTITEEVERVEVMAVSPDGNLLCANAYESILLWSLPDGKFYKSLGRPDDNFVTAVAFSPDGSMLATGDTGNSVRLWSLPECEPIGILEGHTSTVQCLAFSPDSTLLASGSNDATIRLWSLAEGDLLGCPMDLAAMTPDRKGKTYEIINSRGETVTYTIPCRSPLPEGAVCTCNCVKGSGECSCNSYGKGGSSNHYWHPD